MSGSFRYRRSDPTEDVCGPHRNGGSFIHYEGLCNPRPAGFREGIRAFRPLQLARGSSPQDLITARDHIPSPLEAPRHFQPHLAGDCLQVSGESPIPSRSSARSDDDGSAARSDDDGSAARSDDDGSAARSDDDGSVARSDDDGSATRGDEDASVRGDDGSAARGFPRPAKGRETRAFGGLG